MQASTYEVMMFVWVPAFAGMTVETEKTYVPFIHPLKICRSSNIRQP